MNNKYLFGSEDHTITDEERKRYQENKKRKPKLVVLSDEQIVKFAELIAKNAPYGDFERYLNLSVRDVETQKKELGISEMEDARKFLKDLRNPDRKEKVVDNTPEVQAKTTTAEVYESIEDYKSKTQKRFRMTKEQKGRGLTREQAFKETYGG